MEKYSESRRKIEAFCRRNNKYSPDAYEFVTDCVISQVNGLAAPRHLNARELLEGFRQQLQESFGFLSAAILQDWQLFTASDVGEIVFDLISLGILSASAEDQRSDFDIDFVLLPPGTPIQLTNFSAQEIPQID
ncbi:MAG: hypothetical protein E7052_02495 [Lentisphaerae bacterium]|nr:hypothetical protein [Lentisphaerota bacterium]